MCAGSNPAGGATQTITITARCCWFWSGWCCGYRQRGCRHFLAGAGDGVDRVPGQRDAAPRDAACRVVADFEPERFEQPAGCLVGQPVEVDRRDRQVVEQDGVKGLMRLFLGCSELAFQAGAVGPQFGAAFFDVADEVLVEVAGEFQVADQAPALGVSVGDRAAQGLDLAGLFVPRGVAEGLLVGVQQRVTVGAENLVGQEPGQPVEKVVFADAEDDRVAVRPPCLLRRAGIPGGLGVCCYRTCAARTDRRTGSCAAGRRAWPGGQG